MLKFFNLQSNFYYWARHAKIYTISQLKESLIIINIINFIKRYKKLYQCSDFAGKASSKYAIFLLLIEAYN